MENISVETEPPAQNRIEKLNFSIPYSPVISNLNDWPVNKLAKDRMHFIDEIVNFTVKRLKEQHPKTEDLLAETIYAERNRLREEAWKVDPPDEKNFWNRIRGKFINTETQSKVTAQQSREEIIARIVRRYAEEIVGTFNPSLFVFARRTLTFFFRRLLNAAIERWWRIFGSRYQLYQSIQVFGDVEHIRELSQKGTLVVLPTHSSNLDSILIGYAMDSIMGLPSFSYGAGLNLYNSGFFAFFMNRLGAYRVDRRKKNDIYLETLKAMSNLSIQRGTNSLFFPGGTRMRSGAIESKLKMGLLGTVVEAQRANFQNNKDTKIFIVPLTVSYHFVLEAPSLIHQHLQMTGKEHFYKGKYQGNNLREWLVFVWQFFGKKSEVVLSFDKPMDIFGNQVDAKGASFDARGREIDIKQYFSAEGGITTDLQRETEYTKLLADKVADRFHKTNIVLSSHVVAFTAFNMLKENNDGMDIYMLMRLSPEDYIFPIQEFEKAVAAVQSALFELAEKGRLKLSNAVLLPPAELVQDGVKNLGIFHVIKPLLFNKSGDIESDEFSVLYYYHNRLDGFGLAKRVPWQKFKIKTCVTVPPEQKVKTN